MPDARSKTIGSRSGARSGWSSVDDDLVTRPARGIRVPAARADRGQGRPAGEHDPRVLRCRLRSSGRRSRVRPTTISPVNAVCSNDVDAGAEQRGRVGQHVARRVDVAVPGGVRRTERHARRRRPGSWRRTRRTRPSARRGRRCCCIAIRACACSDLGVGEARHEVALLDEARVDPEQVMLAAGRSRGCTCPAGPPTSVPPWARTMPAARELAPLPRRARPRRGRRVRARCA